MKRCIIIGGAPINNYDYINSQIKEDDYLIYCDSGLIHLNQINHQPNLIVGDFDSHVNPNIDVETITLPTEKDDTDTVYGVKEGIKRGYDEFILIGVLGNRFDHSLGNVSILLLLDKQEKCGKIIDDYSVIEIVKNTPKYVENSFSYFSLLCVTPIISGVTIENAKYGLNGAEITNYFPIGISNEVLEGKTAKVVVEEGIGLLIKVF